MAPDDPDYLEEESAAEQFFESRVLERFLNTQWDDDWWWLCEQAKQRFSEEQYANWLEHVRKILLDNALPSEGSLPAPPDDGFHVDEATFCVYWRSRTCTLGNTRLFRLIQELKQSPNRYLTFTQLAERMGGAENDDIRPIKSRLTTKLKEADMDELACCIRTQNEHYGLFLPADI